MSRATFHAVQSADDGLPQTIESFVSCGRIEPIPGVKHLREFGKVQFVRTAARGAAVLVIAAATWPLAGCRSEATSSAAGAAASADPRPVRLVAAESRQLAETVVGNGTLAADEESALAFKVPGRLASIRIDLGSVVKEGDEIGRLDATDYELKVQQAQAALQQARVRLGLDPLGTSDRVDAEATGTVRQARAVLDEAAANRARSQKLAASGVISKAELDATESAYRVADARYQDALDEVRNRQGVLLQRRSELEIARQQLADTALRAPFGGAVSERIATQGEYLAAGAKVATLVRLHPLRLRAEIPEREAEGVRVGQPVVVHAEGQTENSEGRVVRVSPVVNQQNRVLMFEIEVNNESGRLRPGGFARAEIATAETATAVIVPASSIVTFAGIQKVLTTADGKVVERNVTTGRTEHDEVEIVSGLAAGDLVIVDPGNLTAGQPVVAR